MVKKVFIIIGLVMLLVSCRRQYKAVENWRGDLAEISTVYADPNKRLADYHWFEDMYQTIKAQESKIRRYDKDSSIAQQMILNYDTWVSDYNAKSRQYDRVLWKRQDLPYSLEFFTW